MTDHPDIRIGDRERLVVQDRLRDAYSQGALTTEELEERLDLALRARIQSDLVPLTADLPPPMDESLVPTAATPDPVLAEERSGGGHGPPWGWILVAFILLGGAGAVQQLFGGIGDIDAVTVFGSRQLTLTADEPEISVLTIFGSMEISVPEDVRASNNTTPIFGSSECTSACATGVEEGRTTVTVSGLTLFGSVEFLR